MRIDRVRSVGSVFLALTLLVAGSARAEASPAPADALPITLAPSDLILGPASAPQSVLVGTLERSLRPPYRVEILAADGSVLHEVPVTHNQSDATLHLPVPMPEGESAPVTVRLTEGEAVFTATIDNPRPDPQWVVHFIPGFHYDPVWWNTQAHYTETGRYMEHHVGPGISLVDEYLQLLEADEDYRVAFHQLPYLKSFVEARSERRGALRTQIDRGCCELVGGTYNELSTTLVNAESTLRNAAFGTRFQRDVLGGTGSIFWQCDVFGHDPMFPSLMARTGHVGGAFARGPFHQWGAARDRVNFPSEFRWMSPDGESVLTHYMTGHYGYAYARFAPGTNRAPEDPARSNAMIAEMFLDLKQPALTHHVMMPMHMDFIRPLENLGEVVRTWNQTYLAPRAVIATPEMFFAAVEHEIEARGLVVPVITRDMNPIYTGCPVSFADLKTSNREAESRLREAELWATFAWLDGLVEYPEDVLERAWRQVLFNAHHDGVTGSMSDQVYLDIMAGYRDAIDGANTVKERAQAAIVSAVDGGDAEAVVFNSVPRSRTSAADPAVGIGVPSLGYRAIPKDEAAPNDATARVESGVVILENALLRLEIDHRDGGGIRSVVDRRTDRELLRDTGNRVAVLEEYSVLPGHGEGPWHLAPTGERSVGGGTVTQVDVNLGSISVETQYPRFRTKQTITLRPGEPFFDCDTEILDFNGSDQLLRVEFPFDLPGTRPLFQTAGAVIGRPFGRNVDTQEDSWTLDQAAWQWVGLGAAVTLDVVDAGEVVHRRALGVGEIVVSDDPSDAELRLANRLAEAWVKSGVTTTIVEADRPRYGDLAVDSNLPDFRVYFGDPDGHSELRGWSEAGKKLVREALGYAIDPNVPPVILMPPREEVVEAVIASLAESHRLVVPYERTLGVARGSAPPPYGVAIANRGSVSAHLQENGTVSINLMRSCTSWPSGVWIDPPYRRLPDGAPLGTMHGSHRFSYRVIPYVGDHREVGIDAVAHEFQHPLTQVARSPESDRAPTLPALKRYLDISHPGVQLLSLRPAGYPSWGWESVDPAASRAIALRLWNAAGRTVRTQVTFDRALAAPAKRTDALERPAEGAIGALEPSPNGFWIELGPQAIETVVVELARAESGEPEGIDPTTGDRSPSEYWLENRGEGVSGNGVIAVVPAAREAIIVRGRASIPVRLVNNHRTQAAVIALSVEHSDALEIDLGAETIEVPPSSDTTVLLAIRSPKPDPAHRSAVTVVAKTFGRSFTGSVWLRGEGGAATALDSGAEFPVVIENAASMVHSSGGNPTLRATIVNSTAGPLTGVARWLSPEVLWRHQSEWRQLVTIPAGGRIEIETSVIGAPDTYALLQFIAAGRTSYGAPIAITPDRDKVISGFGVDRVRLRRDEPVRVELFARGFSGRLNEARLSRGMKLDVPDGWTVAPPVLEERRDEGGVTAVRSVFRVEPASEAPIRGTLTAVGPDGRRSSAAYSIAPRMEARRAMDSVTVDADLSDWDPAEFTECSGDLHDSVRCAVRYGVSGLALAFEVSDDRFVQTKDGATIWEGDSVQFAVSVAPSTVSGYGHHDLEFGSALTPSGPVLWCWYAGEGRATGLLSDGQVAVEHRDGKLFYEMMLPRSVVPQLSLEPGAVLGFSFIANDDDGEGYAGATQWTGGMVGGKDASLFGELFLK